MIDRQPRRAACALLGALMLVVGVVSCSDDSGTDWADISPSPGAESYEGEVEVPLDTRLDLIVSGNELKVLDSRLEYLPAGVDWNAHLDFRDQNVDGLSRQREFLPEPDRDVLLAEYTGDGRSLYVIATSDARRERLVVLTTLTEPG